MVDVIYSAKLLKGLDVSHYDIVFEETRLRLRYLGEYWEKTRPVTGLQKQMDLHIYRIKKRRRRRDDKDTDRNDIVIAYKDIASYRLYPPRIQRTWKRIGGRKILEEKTEPPKLVIELKNRERFELVLAPRVYRLAKTLVKKYLAPYAEKRL